VPALVGRWARSRSWFVLSSKSRKTWVIVVFGVARLRVRHRFDDTGARRGRGLCFLGSSRSNKGEIVRGAGLHLWILVQCIGVGGVASGRFCSVARTLFLVLFRAFWLWVLPGYTRSRTISYQVATPFSAAGNHGKLGGRSGQEERIVGPLFWVLVLRSRGNSIVVTWSRGFK